MLEMNGLGTCQSNACAHMCACMHYTPVCWVGSAHSGADLFVGHPPKKQKRAVALPRNMYNYQALRGLAEVQDVRKGQEAHCKVQGMG